MFVLNRCDEVDINVENCKKEYEKILEINKREKTWNEIIATKIKRFNVNVTKFSNSLYFKYNKFVERINDYEKYLNEIENKIDKKREKIFDVFEKKSL